MCGSTPGPVHGEEEWRIMGTMELKKTGPAETIEPVMTVFDDGKFLHIHTELPDIAEEKIRIDLENHSTSVTIAASDTERQYKTSITVPCGVRFCKKRFSDGVLELTLEKSKS